jgi:hypothetical protein
MHNLFQNFKIRALYKTALSSHVPKHIKELSISCIIASLALGTRNEYRYIGIQVHCEHFPHHEYSY